MTAAEPNLHFKPSRGVGHTLASGGGSAAHSAEYCQLEFSVAGRNFEGNEGFCAA